MSTEYPSHYVQIEVAGQAELGYRCEECKKETMTFPIKAWSMKGEKKGIHLCEHCIVKIEFGVNKPVGGIE